MTAASQSDEFFAAVRKFRPGISKDLITPARFPFVLARVFRKQVAQLITELRSGKVFGGHPASIQVALEYQKRGIPHNHCLVTVENLSQSFFLPSAVDQFVTARLFLYEQCPLSASQSYEDAKNAECSCAAHQLYTLVKKFMRHTCSTSRCLTASRSQARRCSKFFPHSITATRQTQSGFWEYRRDREDDRWVVPYNPYLLTKYLREEPEKRNSRP